MLAYVPRTGTRTTIAELRRRKWRLLISAVGRWNAHGLPYAIDNGAWTASELFRKGKRKTADPDLKAFVGCVDRMGSGADFIVVPDIVAGGLRSWLLTRYWLRKLRRNPKLKKVKLLIAVQDGFTVEMVAPFISERVGIFVGGSTEWKLKTARQWGQLARSRGALCHVGRVNSARRWEICERAGATSADGASGILFPCTIPELDDARQRLTLEGEMVRRSAAMSPEEFARQAQQIVAELRGHARHRAFDRLTEEALAAAGYAQGVRIFEDAVSNWHGDADAYPYPQNCPDCEGTP